MPVAFTLLLQIPIPDGRGTRLRNSWNTLTSYENRRTIELCSVSREAHSHFISEVIYILRLVILNMHSPLTNATRLHYFKVRQILTIKNIMCFAAAVLALMGPMAQAHATGVPAPEVQTASNVDGSSLRLITNVAKNNSVQITDVLLSTSTGKPVVKIGQVVQLIGENKRALILLTDWAKEGNHAIETVDECGAGPNCTGIIYRVDAKQQKIVEFFKTSGADISLIGGYLIEKSRDSCCAWVADAYKLNMNRTQVAASPAFSVEISYNEDRKNSKPVTCTFYKETTRGRVTIDPPAKAFLKICDHYHEPYLSSHPVKVD